MSLDGRVARVAACALSVLLGAAGAATAQPANGTSLPGDVARRHTRGATAWCAVDGGSGLYRRSSATQVTIDFPEVLHTELTTPTAYHRLRGAGRLTFTSATAGTIGFELSGETVAAIYRPTFSGYVETWDAGAKRLTVRFQVEFPSCSVLFLGHFFGP
jgi:hypothetical protein